MSRKLTFKASLYKSLVEGFSNKELDELEYLQGFEVLNNYFNDKTDLKQIVTEVVEHVERHLLWQELLDWIAIKNPKRFAHHQIRFPKIPTSLLAPELKAQSFEEKVYEFLVSGLSGRELSQIIYHNAFYTLDQYISDHNNEDVIAKEIIGYVERQLLWQELLQWIQLKNPKRYALYQIEFAQIPPRLSAPQPKALSFKGKVHDFLTEGLSDEELRQITYLDGFGELSQLINKENHKFNMVEQIINFAERHELWNELLEWAYLKNPKRYELYQLTSNKQSSKQKKETQNPRVLQEIYLRSLVHQCGELTMTSIDPRAKQSSAAKLKLDSVFVSLDVPHRIEVGKSKPTIIRRRQPVLMAISQEPKLVLLGKPGSGKTTLVSFITYCLAGEKLNHPEINRDLLWKHGWRLPALLPIRVVLRDYAARGLAQEQNIIDFVVHELPEKIVEYGSILQQQLKEEGGVLLLDGLDEVPEAFKKREQLRQAVMNFTLAFPKVRILVTTRPYAYNDPEWQLPDFAQNLIMDLSVKQIENYVHKWYEVTGELDNDLGKERAQQYAYQLSHALKRNPNLAELAPRPLLLALMVSLHRWRGGGALPQEREQLYDQSVELLIDLWQRPKQLYDEQGRPDSEESSALTVLGLNPSELRHALSEVAFWAHENQPNRTGTADIPAEKLAGVLYNASAHHKDVSLARVIEYVKDRAGLLEDKGPDQRGRHIYSFPHRTFQEYLAACHFLETDEFPDNLAELAKADLDRWREATLLVAGRAPRATAWDLVGALCMDDPPSYEHNVLSVDDISDVEWGGALLAGLVIKERQLQNTTVKRQQRKLQRVQKWLHMAIEQGAMTPFDRNVAGKTLAILGEPRKGLVPQTLQDLVQMSFCYVPASSFWLGSDKGRYNELPMLPLEVSYSYWLAQHPVTVGQYNMFLQESRYQVQGNFLREGRKNPPNVPAHYLTWHDALAYCKWLNQQYPLPNGLSFCLPSEVEWEKAAKGGIQVPHTPIIQPLQTIQQEGKANAHTLLPNPLPQRRYPWGDEFEPHFVNGEETGLGRTSIAGMFPQGRGVYGNLDMSGNVWEWTRSHWKGYPYSLDGERENLWADNNTSRVLRGGSYVDNAHVLRCAFRVWNLPYFGHDHYGLRVAISPVAGKLW